MTAAGITSPGSSAGAAHAPGTGGFGRAVRTPMAAVVAAVFLLVTHIFFSAETYSLKARVMAAGIGWLAFLIARRADGSRAPFVEFAAVQVYLYFGVATFWDSELTTIHGPVMLTEESVDAAVFAMLLSLGLLFAASKVGDSVADRIRTAMHGTIPVERTGDFAFAARAGAAFLFVALLIVTIFKGRLPEGIVQPLAILARPPLAIALLAELMRRSPTRLNTALFWGYTLAAMAGGIVSGMLVQAVTPLVAASYCLWLHRRRLPWMLGAFLIAGFVIVNPMKYAFRRAKVARVEVGESVGFREALSLWSDAFSETWVLGDDDEELEDNLAVTTRRVSAILNIAHAIEWVPTQVPYTGVNRWLSIPAENIPRFLWKDKPNLTRTHNGEYALTFGLQTESALEHTAINFPLVTDGYWAMGWPGIVIVSLVVGFILGCYRGFFRTVGWGETVIAAAILPYIVPHHDMAKHMTGVPQRLVLFIAVVWAVHLLAVLRGRARAGQAAFPAWRAHARPRV